MLEYNLMRVIRPRLVAFLHGPVILWRPNTVFSNGGLTHHKNMEPQKAARSLFYAQGRVFIKSKKATVRKIMGNVVMVKSLVKISGKCALQAGMNG